MPADSSYFENLRNIYESSIVRGERVYLRNLRESDIDEHYLSYFSDEGLVRFFYGMSRRITCQSLVEEINRGVESGQYHMYGIFDVASDACIGNVRIGYMVHDHKISDLVIYLGDRRYHGKGVSVEAISLGNRLCFEYYDFRKLFGGMYEANMASVKAYTRADWIVEGRLKGHYLVDGNPMDRILVGCFNPKYFPAQEIEQAKVRQSQFL